jgi:hypothetical protein
LGLREGRKKGRKEGRKERGKRRVVGRERITRRPDEEEERRVECHETK